MGVIVPNGMQLRVRLQHSHTLKEGWRLSETTVEWIGEGDPNWDVIHAATTEAHEHGADEAARRNDSDAAQRAA